MDSFDGPMTSNEFVEILDEFGLSVYASTGILGLSLRQAQRYAAGDPISPPTARLLRVLKHHIDGLKKDRKRLLRNIEALESGRGKIYENRVDITDKVNGENRRMLKEIESLLSAHPSGLKNLI